MIRFIHRIFRLNSITSRFFFWIFTVVILTSCLYLFSFVSIDRNKRIAETEANLEYGLNNQRIIVENWAAARAEEIRLLSSFQVSKELKLDTMAKRFQYYHEHYSQVDSIVFIDAEGFVNIDTASSDLILTNSEVSLAERDYFIAAKQGKEYMYDVVVSKASGHPTIIFSAPILSPEKRFQGLIFSAVHLSKLNDMLSQTIQGKSGEITLINEEGFIISHLSKNENPEDHHEVLSSKVDSKIMDKISSENEGFFEDVNRSGDKVYRSFTSLFDGRYYLVNEINKKEVLQSHYQIVTLISIIGIAIILVGFILIIPVSQQLLRPFVYIVGAINRITTGKYDTQLDTDKFVSSPKELQEMVQGFNKMASSIYENKQVLQKISYTDGLTGIPNRRLFEERLETEWQRAGDYQKPISLIFIDIDHFKKYNDHFGHQQGDQCLIKVAKSINDSMESPNDLLARFGGEEFTIILPNRNNEEATRIAENVRKQVERLQIPASVNDKEDFVTVSVGVATKVPSETVTKETLIQSADQAVYEAKTGGRNRVIVKT